MQSWWSRVVVTLRPLSSTWEETVLAVAFPRPDDELEEEEETDTAERDDPRDEALARATPLPRVLITEGPPGSGIVDRISRPSARMRIIAQVPLARGGEPAIATAAAPIATTFRNAIAALLQTQIGAASSKAAPILLGSAATRTFRSRRGVAVRVGLRALPVRGAVDLAFRTAADRAGAGSGAIGADRSASAATAGIGCAVG